MTNMISDFQATAGYRLSSEKDVAALTGIVLTVSLMVWLVLAPLLNGTSSIEMLNPTTRQRVVCRATMAPAYKAREVVALCRESREAKGFLPLDGQVVYYVDFESWEAEAAAARPFKQVFPTACRS